MRYWKQLDRRANTQTSGIQFPFTPADRRHSVKVFSGSSNDNLGSRGPKENSSCYSENICEGHDPPETTVHVKNLHKILS